MHLTGSQLKKLIQKIVSLTGYALVDLDFLAFLKQEMEDHRDALIRLRGNTRSIPHLAMVMEDLRLGDAAIGLARQLEHSRAQLAQDLFVLNQLHSQTEAHFFVEFGATDGVALSNTYLLEKHFGWQGILAEPARCWHQALRSNRHCRIDYRCVATESGHFVDFLEVANNPSSGLYITPELSGLASHADNGDWAAEIRRDHSTCYQVETLSLCDLLAQHNAPREIGYLSVDTEGSELDILKAFDFDAYKIHVITVEHNYKDDLRSGIHTLLLGNGYKRLFEEYSDFDDWYVLV
jgi:FkbM family methyltransferase